ncbi:hypothetical protein AWC38_SpisGene20779 [Stylophora pistillata]|uniref:Tyr recombinase domain-containing protein n=1 Tax=Stylophora pistillata TaxID=50429 RepID=A0A2B4RFA6_STYPI|nr:hypothetical protein AWC38_SpisGene20779 [Stylophora pistillata]
MASGGLSPETVKERVDKYPPPENCKFLCTTKINEKVWDLLPRRSRTVHLAFQKVQELLVQVLPSLSILGDQLVKDLQTGKPTNVRQVLDQVMDSISLVANANYKLNMKRRELIKPDLNPTFTRLCKEDIKPSTKLFGDELSKHLKDMADAKKAGQQMQKTSDTRTSSHNYLKAGRQKFRPSNFKPYHRTFTGQKTSQTRPLLGSMGHPCMGHKDDSFLLGYDYAACKRNVQDTIDTFQNLGFVIHPVKSVFIPTQEIEFLGFLLSSILMTFRLPPTKATRSRPGYKAPTVVLRAYPANPSLCVGTCLKEYLKKTKLLRGMETKLFFSFTKPYKRVSRETLSRWIRTVMTSAGVDITIFKPHSTQAAATSKAKTASVPIQEILKTAGWSSLRCFDKFYDEPVESSTFASAFLKTA